MAGGCDLYLCLDLPHYLIAKNAIKYVKKYLRRLDERRIGTRNYEIIAGGRPSKQRRPPPVTAKECEYFITEIS